MWRWSRHAPSLTIAYERQELVSAGNVVDCMHERYGAIRLCRVLRHSQWTLTFMQPSDDATRAWEGKAELWRVFWIYNVLITIALGIVLDILFGDSGFRWLVGVVIGIPFASWSFVSLWRCAYNTKHEWWGHIARAYVILSLPMLLYAFLGQAVV
jgi:hypothetical protein